MLFLNEFKLNQASAVKHNVEIAFVPYNSSLNFNIKSLIFNEISD